MKFIFCTLLILIATFSFGQQLSIKEQKEDLNELKTNLYFVHPALFRFTTQSALDSLFEKIKLQINDSISTYEFSDKITPVFSLIEGMPVKSVGAEEIGKVISFLNRLSDISIELQAFPVFPGADSRTCLGDYIDQIEKRYDRIVLGAKNSEWEKEINDFMKQSFFSHKEFVFNKFYDSIESSGWDAHRPFEETERMFSPSDLGFHNILAGNRK